MSALWPWLAIAGAGALHGLHPVNGWVFAAASGARARGRMRALLPIAAGHALALVLVASTMAPGPSLDRDAIQALAIALLIGGGILHLARRRAPGAAPTPHHAGLALWSFIVSTAHGTGLAMVPALAPLCAGLGSAGETGADSPLVLAAAAVALHTAAMLAVVAAIALGARPVVDAIAALLGHEPARRAASTTALPEPRPSR